jgi:hypothetical protein
MTYAKGAYYVLWMGPDSPRPDQLGSTLEALRLSGVTKVAARRKKAPGELPATPVEQPPVPPPAPAAAAKPAPPPPAKPAPTLVRRAGEALPNMTGRPAVLRPGALPAGIRYKFASDADVVKAAALIAQQLLAASPTGDKFFAPAVLVQTGAWKRFRPSRVHPPKEAFVPPPVSRTGGGFFLSLNETLRRMRPAGREVSKERAPFAATEPTMKITGANLLRTLLERQGIRTIAGIPGGAILPFYDALHGSAIRHVLTRHEQGAGFIAQGMARVTGRAAVCLATSGPGATNLLTAIADARLDSVPLVAITGQVSQALIGTDAFQEVDTYGLTLPITKHNFLVRHPTSCSRWCRWRSNSPSPAAPAPVAIDVPKDVQTPRPRCTPGPSPAAPRRFPPCPDAPSTRSPGNSPPRRAPCSTSAAA